VQGIGAAALVPSSLAIISASFDEKSRGQAIGTWSGFTAITTALGPVLGGWLIQHFSWHWVFFINVPLAAAVIVISLYHVPESRTSAPQPVDWIGAVVATLGLGGVVYGFIESAALGWRHPLIMGSLIGGAGALVLFVFIERHVSAPMMPLRLFKSRNFSGANLLTLFLYAAIGTFFFLVPLNLIQIQKYSATAAGAASIPVILFLFALSRWSGGLVSRYGAKLPLIIGPLIVAVGFLLFAVPSVGGSYWRMFLGPFVVLGLGMAVSVAPLTTVVMTSVEQDRTGTASGINNAVARVAGVLAVAILGVVMVQAFGSRLERSLSHLNLDPNTLHEIHSNRVKLAAIEVPNNLDAATVATIRTGIVQAFIFGFRVVMVICAGLALASSVVAWLMISSDRVVAGLRLAKTGHSPVTTRA
jgi:EmrB/QacA subfamily drug resistance transporter